MLRSLLSYLIGDDIKVIVLDVVALDVVVLDVVALDAVKVVDAIMV